MTNIVDLAARSTQAVDLRLAACDMSIGLIRNSLDSLIQDMTIIRDNSERGDPIRAVMRQKLEHLEKAFDILERALP